MEILTAALNNPDIVRYFFLSLGGLMIGVVLYLAGTLLHRALFLHEPPAKLYAAYLGMFSLSYVFMMMAVCAEIVLRLGHRFSWRFAFYIPAFTLLVVAIGLRVILVRRTGRDYLPRDTETQDIDSKED